MPKSARCIPVYILIYLFFSISYSSVGEAQKYVADHTVAKENVLRSIPVSAINAAKNNLHIMYCGTSHSSQTSEGMKALQNYKSGDAELFAVSFDGTPRANTLDIDYRPTSPVNVYSALDLSHDGTDLNGYTDYYYRTIEYLDHPDHADVNVVMWSWCSIEGHDVQIYLDNMTELINMYRAGGSKGRTAGNAVTFVLMTGYARGTNGDIPEPPYIESPYQNHKRIVDYCRANKVFCLDYWSHDTHHYETDEYYPTAQGNSPTHLLEWMNAHPGQWYESTCAHASDYSLLCNRRAYAAWWLWARIAGWNEGSSPFYGDVSENGQISPYDASLTAQHAVGLIDLTESQTEKADVTGNSQVSAADASWIARKAVDPTVQFPVEITD